jgi:hypothetical protein
MSPRWLHWPAAAPAGPDLSISGTTDNVSGTDNDPTVSPSVAGLLSFQVVAGNRVTIRFEDVGGGDGGVTERDNFIATYPNGSDVVLVYDGTTYTATNITWTTSLSQARILQSEFDAFPSTTDTGHLYSFSLTL